MCLRITTPLEMLPGISSTCIPFVLVAALIFCMTPLWSTNSSLPCSW
jgi:hypothetical protein